MHAETGRRLASDLMRRRVREVLVRTEGEPLAVGEILTNLMHRSRSSTRRPGEDPEESRRAMFRRANIPARHEQRRGTDQPGPWRSALGQVVSRLGSGFMCGLLGPRGTGKTQIGVSAMVASIRAGRQPLYVKAMDVFLWVRSTFKDDVVTEIDALSEFMSPRLLVIDELTERGETEFEDRILVHLIDKRYDAMHDTLLIGNLKPDEFEASMGPSITSRLRECGGLVVCDWASFRGVA